MKKKTTTAKAARPALTQEQREMIERYGVFMERLGISPAAARIQGLLLISDVTELTFEEIHQRLGLSKSAASNGINFLLATKRAEYITRPGDRKRYFRAHIANWDADMSERMQGMLAIRSLLQDILNLRTKSTVDFNGNLKELIRFLDFLQGELPALFEKWKKLR